MERNWASIQKQDLLASHLSSLVTHKKRKKKAINDCKRCTRIQPRWCWLVKTIVLKQRLSQGPSRICFTSHKRKLWILLVQLQLKIFLWLRLEVAHLGWKVFSLKGSLIKRVLTKQSQIWADTMFSTQTRDREKILEEACSFHCKMKNKRNRLRL